MNKLKIKLGKDQSGRIVHGKIINEGNESEKNQSPLHKTSVAAYQLSLNLDDDFHGFPDTSIPDWVSDDFTRVDLKTKFHIKPTIIASIYSKNYQKKRKQPNLQVESFTAPVFVKPSAAEPSETPSSRKKVSKMELCTQFEIEVELKDAPVKYTTRTRSGKGSHLSSINASSYSHISDAETDLVCTDLEVPPDLLAASEDDWVEDEISLTERSPPLGQSILPVQHQAGSSVQHGDGHMGGVGYRFRMGGIGRTGLGSGQRGSRRKQSVLHLTPNTATSPPHQIPPSSPPPPQIPHFSPPLPQIPHFSPPPPPILPSVSPSQTRQASSDSSGNPGMVTGSGEEVSSLRSSVIVKNPSTTAKHLASSDQPLYKVKNISSEFIDLTDDIEDNCLETKFSSPQPVIRQRRDVMLPTAVGSLSTISYSGVEINLVIPTNNNNNTELKIKLNQDQVKKLRNCLKEV